MSTLLHSHLPLAADGTAASWAARLAVLHTGGRVLGFLRDVGIEVDAFLRGEHAALARLARIGGEPDARVNAGTDLNTLARRILPLRTISEQIALKGDPAQHPASVAGQIVGLRSTGSRGGAAVRCGGHRPRADGEHRPGLSARGPAEPDEPDRDRDRAFDEVPRADQRAARGGLALHARPSADHRAPGAKMPSDRMTTCRRPPPHPPSRRLASAVPRAYRRFMDHPRQTLRRRLLRGLLGAACGVAAPAMLRGQGAAFRFGLTPVFLNNESELLARLQGWLEGALGRPVRFVQRRTYREITNLVLVGDLDAAWICGYPWLANRAALALVAVPLWRGRPLYQAYLIERAGGTSGSLSDLRGDTHAFSDPDSNSGYLVTVSDLLARGHEPEGFFARSFFTYGHRNVVRAVGSGLARSGSVDGYVWEALARTEPGLPAATRIVARSEWMGHPPIVCPRAREGSAEIAAFRQALLSMAEDPDGRAALALFELDGFVAGTKELYDPIARRMALLAGAE